MKVLIEEHLLKQTENSNFIPNNIYEGASAYFELVLAIIHEIYALET